MIEYIVQLPCEVMGQRMMGFLNLNDIMQFEKAAASQKCQSLLRAIFPYCPAIVVVKPPENLYNLTYESHSWFKKRQCRVQLVRIGIELLSEVDFDFSILEGTVELYLDANTTHENIVPFVNSDFSQKITQLYVEGDQDPAVMGVLFSQLCNVRNLYIQSSNLSQWIDHVSKIGPSIKELAEFDSMTDMNMINIITGYCPNLMKLSFSRGSGVSDTNILLSIASNCPNLRILKVGLIYYSTDEQCNADLTAFAVKCPQLEELSLYFQQLTEQSVLTLIQHCSRLKKLKLKWCYIAISYLLALSERDLPLEELGIPMIPIPSAEIAAQCAHALSRIRHLNTSKRLNAVDSYLHATQYLTGLREMDLDSSEDHLLLLHGHYPNLESLYIHPNSSINAEHLIELIRGAPLLHTLIVEKSTCTSDVILVELACSCPQLQKVTLFNSEFTDKGVLALSVDCRQLRVLVLHNSRLTHRSVRQLVLHCRHLTELYVQVSEGNARAQRYILYSSKEIRELRESDSENSDTEVITDRCMHTCLIL